MKPKPQTFIDELDAIAAETDFALGLDHGKSPFTSDVSVHINEGGATTAYSQDGQFVGLAVRFRDDFNRTILYAIDLR